MVKDPYKSKEIFENWFNSIEGKDEVDGLNKANSKLLISFIKDLRIGINVSNSSKKGERSFTRLNHLKQKLVFIFKKLEERKINDTKKVTAQDLHKLFSDMRSGVLQTRFGGPFKSTGDYVKDFKTFWHWHQKIRKNKGEEIKDITEDLDTRGEKPKFVYFTRNDCESIIKKASYDLKPILALAFDSGARVTELMNIKISDFSEDFTQLMIREETSKTFGRKINLMLCPKPIKSYVKKIGLERNDYVCRIKAQTINKELRKIGREVLQPDQIKYKNLTLYAFRHSSACYWLPKYKSESGLKFRFGWKKSDMIHYYTEFLGMSDTIKQDDMYVDITKAELEKDLLQLRRDHEALKGTVKKILVIAKEREILT